MSNTATAGRTSCSTRTIKTKELEYTVRYAEISFQEKSAFTSTSGVKEKPRHQRDTDYPELIHNRCLRLDRIKANHYQLADNGVRI
jgi:hypothetical protein